jgi:hypothetical protein
VHAEAEPGVLAGRSGSYPENPHDYLKGGARYARHYLGLNRLHPHPTRRHPKEHAMRDTTWG